MLRRLRVRDGQYTSRRALQTYVKSAEPLRILFCGSDDFSIASLRALQEHAEKPDSNILSIDVATRVDKLGGRGMKLLRPPPIKTVAQELGLRLHQFDTFTGWTPPDFFPSSVPYINLVVAVSFGLLVPARIIKSAKFGGLNVHPSLLPELRGAAPLNWTIINGHTHTGVSVQTLHPTKFDQGMVLAQTQKIPVAANATATGLREQLAPVGGKLLVHALRQQMYAKLKAVDVRDRKSSLAPKITTAMKVLDWAHDDVPTVTRKGRAIPKLWAYAVQKHGKVLRNVRVLFGDDMRQEEYGDVPAEIRDSLMDCSTTNIPDGTPFAITRKGAEPSESIAPIFLAIKRQILVIPKLLVAGQPEKPASQAAAGAGLFQRHFTCGEYSIHKFRAPLSTAPEAASGGV